MNCIILKPMDNQDDYRKALGEALAQRQEWLEKKELPKLKEEFRVFHSSFSRVYSLLLKKGVINEDPYKNEAKMGEIQVPDTDEFSDSERVEKLSIRLSNYDNQLDFLVNFYQFSLEFLTIDRIKRILGLVKYIDWTHFAVNSTSLNTRALADMVNTLRAGVDPLSATIIGESLQMLSKSTGVILKYLKEITEYDKQLYKYDVRTKISGAMDLNESNALGQIRRNFSQAMPGRAFYPELIEELIKEDYSGDGAALREKVLQELKVADSKPKPEKNTVPLKPTLIEGLNVLGSLSSTINEIISKIDENSGLLENTKNGFWDKFRRLMHQMMNKEPDPLV
ncbi:hypothetical protein LJC14_05855, partial [Treponema sp. OttesenSCG-928-L16]|nr:hypothetical protein [Treponema sp. OttesenSCG-928-L16]